jgi:mannose-6-phosphate isomerase-like protein (cupin superfamily)
VRANFDNKGVNFVTTDDMTQQLGFLSHPKDKEIPPHVHLEFKREIYTTQEVLIIKKGKIQVDLYTPNQTYVESKTLYEGDVIVLVHGGHGFKCLSDVEMIEVKQGPYVNNNDKVRFEPTNDK